MTKRQASTMRPWITAATLGATVGGWALLARETPGEVAPAPLQTTAIPTVVAQPVAVALPPIPTVQALLAYAVPAFEAAPQMELPPIPVVVVPAPRPQTSSAPSAPAGEPQAPAPAAPAAPQPAPPVTTTRSSG